MNLEQIKESLSGIEKAVQNNKDRLDKLEKLDASRSEAIAALSIGVQETNAIVKSMSTNLGNDPDTGMPNTLCGLFAKVNAALDRSAKSDQFHTDELKNLKKEIASLTRAVDTRSWLMRVIEKSSVQWIAGAGALASTIFLGLKQPWHNDKQLIAPKEDASEISRPEREN